MYVFKKVKYKCATKTFNLKLNLIMTQLRLRLFYVSLLTNSNHCLMASLSTSGS